MKQCIDCGKFKELSDFVKDKNKKDGTRNRCKECQNALKRKNPLPIKPRDGFKFCAKCGSEKPLNEFNLRIVYKKRKPFSYCKSCERDMNNSRYEHTCQKCGSVYKSGAKDTKICRKCNNENLGNMGSEYLKQYNSIPENNYWYGKHRFGKENPNYKPSKTDEEREKGRIIDGYVEWRNEVYKRDNYKCVCCNNKKDNNLNAHHLDGYEWCKEKRTDINNGVTLCESCHKKFHKIYGFGKNTKEQFQEFIKQQANTEVINQIAKG